MLLLTQNYLDTAVVAYVLLSALLGFMRGTSREIFKIMAWFFAFLITFFVLPRFARALPLASVVSSYMVGGALLFFLLLAIFSLVFRLIYSLLDLAGMVGFGNRLLGLSLGVIRGFFVFCMAYLIMSLVPSMNEPEFVRTARLRPFIVSGAEFMQGMLSTFVSPQFMPQRGLRRGALEPDSDVRVATKDFDASSVNLRL